MSAHILKTPLGDCLVEIASHAVSKISFLNEEIEVPSSTEPLFQVVATQYEEYFCGQRHTFDFPICLDGTVFQKRVWNALRNIPLGQTLTYSIFTNSLGDPKAIRAVGSAIGKNPIAIAIPCHRVIGSDGSLTGYAGGIWRKKWLLEHEIPSAQLQLF